MAPGDHGQRLTGSSPAHWDVARLIAPHDRTTFLEEYWEAKPLYVDRGEPTYFAGVLTLRDVDELIASASAGEVRVVGGPSGEAEDEDLAPDRPPRRPATSPTGPEMLYERFREGSTLVMSFLQQRCMPLRLFCNELGRELSAGIQANAYVTPAHAQGLPAHYDTHDVFVVQIAGAKRWKLYDSPVEVPLNSQTFRRDEHQPSIEAMVVDLAAGDVLYVPRGVMHEAQSMDSISVHLAVGVLGITWADVLHAAVDQFARSHAPARHTLPIGFAAVADQRAKAEDQVPSMLADLVRNSDPSTLIDHAAAVSTSRLAPETDGYLDDISASGDLHLATPVDRRDRDPWSISVNDGRLMLATGTRRLSMPGRLEPELRWLIAAPTPVSAQELPSSLLPEERLVLFQRLLREGFFRLHTAWEPAESP